MAEFRVLRTAADVTDTILSDAECTEEWFGDGPIDWEQFIDRLCSDYGETSDPPYDIEDYDNAAVRKIQRHVREYRREY